KPLMCEINETSEYALKFRVGKTIDGITIFIVYDDGGGIRQNWRTRELGSFEPVIRLAQRDFLTGPAVWEIERV
ncbi:hypothetical protein K443DRAFT_86559, partial [Laccaria amethystina LaAM-08-1]